MELSAGIIITNGHQFLIGHVTLQRWWDIPKGRVEADETPREAAVRETFEETGLKINPNDLLDIGVYNYLPNKNLHLFLLLAPILPPLSSMRCISLYRPNKA